MTNAQQGALLLAAGVGIIYLIFAVFLFDDRFSQKMALVCSLFCLSIVVLLAFVFPVLGIG